MKECADACLLTKVFKTSEQPYFQCLVAYGKLCSKVWDAIPHYGSSYEGMSSSTESSLENDIQDWFSTIPEDHHLTAAGLSPVGGTSDQNQRLLHHMQTLLYLRGNYIRCLIHRHHVFSSAAISENPVNSRLVVSIAQDTIRILVTLNDTSDLYSRHQVAYNYFLISAISIVLLAVCHAPAQFAQNCRQDFFAAIHLVRGFSRLSLQGRRLWSSIRGMVARLKQVGFRNDASSTAGKRKRNSAKSRQLPQQTAQVSIPSGGSPASQTEIHKSSQVAETSASQEGYVTKSLNFQTTTPDMDLMGDDLMGVFDTFGGAYMQDSVHTVPPASQFDENLSFLDGDIDSFSEYFMGLI
jgi:hypothetical protein